jgi:hypothetical protein
MCLRVGDIFSGLAVVSVIIQLFFSASSLNGDFYNWSATTLKMG